MKYIVGLLFCTGLYFTFETECINSWNYVKKVDKSAQFSKNMRKVGKKARKTIKNLNFSR